MTKYIILGPHNEILTQNTRLSKAKLLHCQDYRHTLGKSLNKYFSMLIMYKLQNFYHNVPVAV